MIKLISKILVITAFILGSVVLLEAGLDFKVPAPPKSQIGNKQSFRFGGRDMPSVSYKSQADQYTILNYYQNFFREQGFSKIKDDKLFDTTTRQIRFKRRDLVVDLLLIPESYGTGVAISKYLQPEGTPELEKIKPSFTDSFFSLPQKDTPGEDLNIIPRPPDSIRWSAHTKGKQATLTYASPLSTDEIRDFYKIQMPYQAWELERETATADAVDLYKRTTGKQGLGIQSPFLDGEDLNQIIYQSHVLDFKGRYGTARVTVFPNFVDKELGSLVTIFYRQGE